MSVGRPVHSAIDPDYAARVRDSFARQAYMGHLGARVVHLAPGECDIQVERRRELTQQHGFFHGGVLASIADSAAGYAAFTLMPANASILTVEYKLNILRPARGKSMVARGRVIKPGRTLHVVQADVFARTENGEEMVVTSLHTLMRLDGKLDRPS